MDLFVAPTLGFDLLYAFIIVRLARRDLVWINVTPHPTADWIARQITEAFTWNEAPRYRSAIGIRSTALPSGIDCDHGHPRQTYRSRLARLAQSDLPDSSIKFPVRSTEFPERPFAFELRRCGDAAPA